MVFILRIIFVFLQCSEDPCDVQRRDVWCSVPGGPCAEALKPNQQRECGSIQCGEWTVGNWSEVIEYFNFKFTMKPPRVSQLNKCSYTLKKI